MTTDTEIDRPFPHQTLARVTVDTPKGHFQSPLTGPVGDPARPLTFGELEEKFLTVTRGIISPGQQEILVEAVLRLISDDGALLLSELGSAGLPLEP